MSSRSLIIGLLAPFLASVASSQQPSSIVAQRTSTVSRGDVASTTAATATRAERAPALDGRLDDPAWGAARTITGFRMWEPVEDAAPRFETEARVTYDDRNLYVAIRAFDPHPDSIIANLGRRDGGTESDRVAIIIDGLHDKRTAYQFGVNPAGVKFDVYMFDDGNEDDSWDAVWDVATRIDSLGWVAEFRIPLSQIRYPDAPEVTFGVAILRDIKRYDERTSWPVFRKSRSGVVSQFGELTGIRGLTAPRRLEVAPYTVAKTYNQPLNGRVRQQQQVAVGGDVKFGLSSNLTVDATVNPDFGQVESDPSELNLSTFETFLQERRPFFLEGQGLFRFEMGCMDGGCSNLFYSRRIGRTPQLSGDYSYDDNATSTTILGAAKLTGQLRKGMSIGVLDAVTQHEQAAEGETIEPRTNYFVGRLQQDLRGGQTGFGVMLTSVHRNLDDWSAETLRRRAYTGGVDFRHQFFNRNYRINAFHARSEVAGSAEAIARTQRGAVHNYSRPDDDLAFDSTLTSLAGHTSAVSFSKNGGGITRFNVGYLYMSPGFESNDAGYLGRANQQNQSAWFQLRSDKPRGITRSMTLNFNQWAMWTTEGLQTEVGGNVNAHAQFRNSWWLHVGQGGNALARSYCDNCSRGGPAIRREPSSWGWAGIEGDSRRSISPNLFWNWGRGDDGRSFSWGVDPSVSLRFSSRLNASVGAGFNRSVDDWAWYGQYDDLGDAAPHYTFANLDRKTLSMTTRLNFTATPTLSLQVYAQPFVTTGRYTDWRELDAPRAASYDDRLKPFAHPTDSLGAFSFKQLRSNTVVRWEYRPGSVLYLVWGQERTEDALHRGEFRGFRDYGTLVGTPPRNVFLIKGSYWLSF